MIDTNYRIPLCPHLPKEDLGGCCLIVYDTIFLLINTGLINQRYVLFQIYQLLGGKPQ